MLRSMIDDDTENLYPLNNGQFVVVKILLLSINLPQQDPSFLYRADSSFLLREFYESMSTIALSL